MQKWIVNDSEIFTNVDDLCSYIFDPDNYEADDSDVDYDIDDCYGSIDICGSKFYASQILQECDYSLYQDFKRQYEENMAENDREEWYSSLSGMTDGDHIDVQGYDVRYVDAETEDEEEEELDEEEETIIKTLLTYFNPKYQQIS